MCSFNARGWRRRRGHYKALEAQLTRDCLRLQLPPPADQMIKIDFEIPNGDFREIRRVLGYIFQRDLGPDAKRNAD